MSVKTADFTTYGKESADLIALGKARLLARTTACPNCGYKPRIKRMKVFWAKPLGQGNSYVVQCPECNWEIKRVDVI